MKSTIHGPLWVLALVQYGVRQTGLDNIYTVKRVSEIYKIAEFTIKGSSSYDPIHAMQCRRNVKAKR